MITYRSRWHIEDYHKVLKTGYQVDEIYLHTSKEAIKKLLIMPSISACRLYWLIYIGRTEASIKASDSCYKTWKYNLKRLVAHHIVFDSVAIAHALAGGQIAFTMLQYGARYFF